MNWILDSKFTLALFGILCGVIGYLYKSRKERKGNLKAALYLLLEIWHRVSMLAKADFDKEFEALITDVERKFPEAALTPEEAAGIKTYFSPLLLNSLHLIALEGHGSFEEAYNTAIMNISKDDPVFAYKVNSSVKVRHFISYLDSYVVKALAPFKEGEHVQFARTISEKLKGKVKVDSLKDLERDIVSLSRRIGIICEIKVRRLIRERKRRLASDQAAEASKLIDEILFPAIKELNEQVQPNANKPAD